MNPFIILIFLILIFGLSISIGIKIENHFDYLKILYPDKFEGVSSLMDSRQRFKGLDNDFTFKIFIPVFYDRNKLIEQDNYKLNKIGNKINRSLYFFWINLILFVGLIVLLNFNLI